MRTTLDLDDAILRAAKERAAKGGQTLTSLVTEALRRHLAPRRRQTRPFRLHLLTRRGRPVRGSVLHALADRDALHEFMEGRA